MATSPISPAELSLLLAKTSQGDRHAFSKLYDATSAKLFSLAIRILTRRDLAEEALQDAFVSIWHHAGSFNEGRASAMTWMTTIMRNRCLDLLRAMPHEHGLGEGQDFDQWASEDLSPIEQAISGQEAHVLLNCMKALAPLQRQAIAMSYFHGLAHEQLAQQLIQPLGTIKTWIRRGLQSLKNCIAKA